MLLKIGMQHSKDANLEEGIINNKYNCTCTFFALRALPRNFVPFVVAHLSWDWDTPLMVPDVALITTYHPFFSFWHSTFAVNIECDFIECSLLNVANSARKWLKQLVVETGVEMIPHFTLHIFPGNRIYPSTQVVRHRYSKQSTITSTFLMTNIHNTGRYGWLRSL